MRKLSSLVVVLGVVAAGCGGSSSDTTATSTEGGSPTTGVTTTTAAAPITTASIDVTTTQASADGGDADCLVGTWLLDSEAFVQNFDSIMAEAGMPDVEVSTLDGSFTVELSADGSLEAEREEWGFRMTMPEGTFIVEINGTEVGSWSAEGPILTVDTDVSDIEVSGGIEVGGELIEMPTGQFPIEPPPGIATGSEYTCSGDVLTLTNAGVESVLTRA